MTNAPVGGPVRIASVGSAFPPYYVDQDTLVAAFVEAWASRYHNLDRITELHRQVQVGGRHLALPLASYAKLASFTEANDAWIRVGMDVGAAAIEDALARAGLHVRDVDALWCTSVTGIAAPAWTRAS